jgi:hypothetical protein
MEYPDKPDMQTGLHAKIQLREKYHREDQGTDTTGS